jgi:hypothetical protein
LRFEQIIWLPAVEEKLYGKHHVIRREVEEALKSPPLVKFVEKGHQAGEDVYAAYGRTGAGRYLIIFYIAKPNKTALIISGRDMTNKERKAYGKRK